MRGHRRRCRPAGRLHPGVSDLVMTRENHRRLRTADGSWVRNGVTLQVVVKHPTAHSPPTLRTRPRHGGTSGSLGLEPYYVARYVQLGYALTAHRTRCPGQRGHRAIRHRALQ